MPGFLVAFKVANFFKNGPIARTLSHNFAAMLFKSNYIKKSFSAILLVMLLFIHSIKLLHTHSSNQIFSDEACKNNIPGKDQHNELTKTASDCSICSYQPGKDADDLVYPGSIDRDPVQNIFNTRLIPFHKLSLPSAFENRGPPFLI